VSSASPARKLKPDMESLKEAALQAFQEAQERPRTFRISANRLEKTLPHKSQEINTILGAHVVEKTGCKVSLKEPGLDISFDLTAKAAYMYSLREEGPGGLPVGVSGKVAVLMSGGIDSPVAAWLLMRRGCEATLLHFLHGDHLKDVPDKLRQLTDRLRQYSPDVRLACIPVSKVEKELIMNVPADYRIVVLRRLFLRLAERFCRKHGLAAIASGDNLGQVASQTLDNMSVIGAATQMPWLRPVECFNKQEIVDLAAGIGTYGLSIEEFTDCCSFLVPKHPTTAADPAKAAEYESRVSKEVLADAFEGLFWDR
jgi:tRNA uracil 4-sulfurtransferase